VPARRTFLRAAAAGVALPFGGCGGGGANAPRDVGDRAGGSTGAPSAAGPPAARAPAPRPLDLLVLGGTGFIGPHLVRHAVARGHRVTIFTRGRREADLPPSVVRLRGDRDGRLEALAGKRWDAAFDDSATNPDWVRQSAALLRDAAGRYLYTSSTGVYYPYLARGLDESAPLRAEPADPADVSATYAAAKARCEGEVRRAFGDRALVVRPTYIVGPGDTTDRFPYWPDRLARGGEVLAPGRRDDPVQFIDVRDLAEFMLGLVEAERAGTFNVAGPRSPLAFADFLEAARRALGARAAFTWVDDYAFLKAHGIEDAIPWVMLAGNDYGATSVRNDRAAAAGLAFRPLEQTVRDTLAWWSAAPAARRQSPRFSITPEREARALADWRARAPAPARPLTP
jgi:2'-hydroxyisoflavone reductase